MGVGTHVLPRSVIVKGRGEGVVGSREAFVKTLGCLWTLRKEQWKGRDLGILRGEGGDRLSRPGEGVSLNPRAE